MDYRRLNLIAEPAAYPLPRIDHIFSALYGSKYFTSLDVSKGFWQIPIDPADCYKTAFVTPFGLFEWTRLPMGLNSAPGAFQLVMNKVLGGLIWNHVLVYVDDVLVFTPTFEQHLMILKEVFRRLKKADLKLRPSKCAFAHTELKYLGHIINSHGIAVNPKQVAAVKQWPEPKCVKDVESFLGKVNYYNKFIPNFSKVATPLFGLKKKNAKFDFTPECRQAFEFLKDCLLKAPILVLPNFQLEFIVTTDASGYGLGAVLSQEGPQGEQVICYASRTLRDAEWRYAVIEKEALGIVWACKQFEEYLEGRHFTIITDHKPLLQLMLKEIPNRRLVNFAMKLSHLVFTIKHRPGAMNPVADALSRYPIKEARGRRSKQIQTNEAQLNEFDPLSNFALTAPRFKPVASTIQAQAKAAAKQRPKNPSPIATSEDIIHPDQVYEGPKPVPSRAVLLTVTGMNMAEVQATEDAFDNLPQLQREDPRLKPIYDYLYDRSIPNNPVLARAIPAWATSFYISPEDQTLRHIYNGRALICIPEPLRPMVIRDCHDATTAAHRGITNTVKDITQRFWWPQITQDVAKYVARCPQCLRHKPPPRHTQQPMQRRPIPTHTWQRVHLDVWSPGLPASRSGKTSVVAFIDSFSKYLIAVPTKDHTAQTCVNVFLKHVGCHYGLPAELISDGAPEFRGRQMSQLCAVFGVTKHLVTPYHPESNGQIERVFRTLRPLLASIIEHDPANWDQYLQFAVYAYNTSYHSSIQNTPFFLMFGRDAAPLVSDRELGPEINISIREWLEGLTFAREKVHEALTSAQNRAAAEMDRRANPQEFFPGDAVLLKVEVKDPSIPQKLHVMYTGPFRVLDVEHHVLKVVPVHLPHREPKFAHSSKARRCDTNILPPAKVSELDLPFLEDPAALVDPNLEAEAIEQEVLSDGTSDQDAATSSQIVPRPPRVPNP